MVKHTVAVNGEIAGVPDIGVPKTQDDEAEERHAAGLVEGGESRHHLACVSAIFGSPGLREGTHERVNGVKKHNVPVEGGEGVEHLCTQSVSRHDGNFRKDYSRQCRFGIQ